MIFENQFMKTSKSILFLTFFLVTFLSCNNETVDFTLEEGSTSENNILKWWILVHPSYGNPGIYLYNETESTIEKILPLPEPEGSPHALDFDGTSLWLGGASSNNNNGIITYNPIYEINPDTGNVISIIENIRTEGIAIHGDHIYYSTYGQIVEITKTGTLVNSIPVEDSGITDLAIYNSNKYYVYNGAIDPIIKINETTGQNEFILETDIPNPYTLAIVDNNFVVVSNNHFRRFDLNTKEHLSDIKIEIDGWITAIAPYNR